MVLFSLFNYTVENVRGIGKCNNLFIDRLVVLFSLFNYTVENEIKDDCQQTNSRVPVCLTLSIGYQVQYRKTVAKQPNPAKHL